MKVETLFRKEQGVIILSFGDLEFWRLPAGDSAPAHACAVPRSHFTNKASPLELVRGEKDMEPAYGCEKVLYPHQKTTERA